MPLGLVLVLPVHGLRLAVVVEAVVHVLAALDVELQVLEGLLPLALEVHVQAGDVVDRGPLKVLVHVALHLGALPHKPRCVSSQICLVFGRQGSTLFCIL